MKSTIVHFITSARDTAMQEGILTSAIVRYSHTIERYIQHTIQQFYASDYQDEVNFAFYAYYMLKHGAKVTYLEDGKTLTKEDTKGIVL